MYEITNQGYNLNMNLRVVDKGMIVTVNCAKCE